MKKRHIIIGCLCVCFCCLCLLCGCHNMNVSSAQKEIGGASSATIYTNVLSSQIINYQDQAEISEVLAFFDNVKFIKTSVSQQDIITIKQSSVNVDVLGKDGRNSFTVSITKDNKVYLQLDNAVYVSNADAVNRDEFISNFGVIVIN